MLKTSPVAVGMRGITSTDDWPPLRVTLIICLFRPPAARSGKVGRERVVSVALARWERVLVPVETISLETLDLVVFRACDTDTTATKSVRVECVIAGTRPVPKITSAVFPWGPRHGCHHGVIARIAGEQRADVAAETLAVWIRLPREWGHGDVPGSN